MQKIKKALLAIALLALLAGPLAACNTVEGLGQDTKAAGKGLENAAQDNKSY